MTYQFFKKIRQLLFSGIANESREEAYKQLFEKPINVSNNRFIKEKDIPEVAEYNVYYVAGRTSKGLCVIKVKDGITEC
jgi:hypothetical protein